MGEYPRVPFICPMLPKGGNSPAPFVGFETIGPIADRIVHRLHATADQTVADRKSEFGGDTA